MIRAPVYIIAVTPRPGVDDIRALRWALKAMLRRFGLRCLSIEERAP
jgi:hypothetical protein